MKAAIALLMLAATVGAGAQNAQRFRWDWRNAQELNAKRTVGNSLELSTAERRELIHAVAQHIKTVMDPGADATALASRTRVKLIDLNGDGRLEVIAQPVGTDAGCGATGNCPFWVFEKTTAGYAAILSVNRGVQVFTIEPAMTNGFRNLILGSHDAAGERTLRVFRYTEGRYRPGGCYKASWWTYNSGFHKLKEPQITPCAK